MKILVTGGSGFLGSHIVDVLEQEGHLVTIFDTHVSKYSSKDTKIIIGDIRDEKKVLNAVEGNDIIYHFSGISGIEDCKQSPKNSFEINTIGTLNILEACVKFNIERLIFASSAYVFSKYGYIYRTSKIACENLIHDYNEIFNIPYTIIRYGSLYGRRADERNTIYKLLYNALKYNKLVYKGSGNELREYIHVVDAAKISAEILDNKYKNKDIIITGNEKYIYSDIIKIIKEIIGKPIDVIIKPNEDLCHYTLTPYSFNPNIGIKVTRNEFIDFGQGILDCLEEITEQIK